MGAGGGPKEAISAREKELSQARAAADRDRTRSVLGDLRRGEIIALPGGKRRGYAVVLDVDRHVLGGPQVDLLDTEERRRSLRPGDVPSPPAVIDPLRAQSMFDFSEPALIEDARAVLRADLSTLRHFRPVPELAFVGRAASGLYWMLRALKARVPVAACLDEAIGG